MPSEADLRKEFHDNEPGGAIDLDAVLRRSRARRRPRVVAAALVTSLAAVGIVVPVSISLASANTTTSTFSAGSGASAPHSQAGPVRLGGETTNGEGAKDASGGIKRAPASKINLCTGTLAETAPADDGLVLTVGPVDAAAGARDIPVTVTLTNTGTERVTGSLSPYPTVTFSRDGVVLWHSNGPVPSLAQVVDLAPGASATFQTTFEPVICGVADDEQESFRTDLPDAAAGGYQLSAALDFSPDAIGAAGSGNAVLVTGPTSPVTLH